MDECCALPPCLGLCPVLMLASLPILAALDSFSAPLDRLRLPFATDPPLPSLFGTAPGVVDLVSDLVWGVLGCSAVVVSLLPAFWWLPVVPETASSCSIDPSSSSLSPAPAPFFSAKAPPPPEREGALYYPPVRFVPQGSIVSSVPPSRRRALLSILGRGVQCRAAGLLTAVGHSAIGSRTQRTAHGDLSFTRAEEIKVGRLRQAQSIAKQGAQG